MEELQKEQEQTQLKNFYTTFGVQYSQVPHPMGEHIHPNGYGVIQAVDRDTAYAAAFVRYEQRWAFLYNEDDFDASYHPLGCIDAVSATESGDRIVFSELDMEDF